MTLYSDGGPVPATPADFAAEVQALALDNQLTSAAELHELLGQLAIAYANSLIPGGIELQEGPWPVARPRDCGCLALWDPIEHTHTRKVEK